MGITFKKGALFALIASFGLSGCATIFSGSQQTIHIQVVDSNNQIIPGVACRVTDGSGEYSIGSNPGSVTVQKGGTVRVNCNKKGYSQMNMAVGDSFNATTAVNALFWPGFLVDLATGAHKKYPSHYVVTMVPQGAQK